MAYFIVGQQRCLLKIKVSSSFKIPKPRDQAILSFINFIKRKTLIKTEPQKNDTTQKHQKLLHLSLLSVTSYTVVTSKMRSYSTSILAHLFGIIALILMLVWLLHYREGIEYDSGNPLRVFNVCFLCFSSLIDCLFILNNCHILLYLIFSQLCRLTLF